MKTSLAVNIAQSNFVCVCLAVTGVFAFLSQEMSLLTKLACAVLVLDALLGAAIFVAHNQEDIYKELGVYKEYKKMKHFQELNCQGHITNLNMEFGRASQQA